MRLRLTRTFTRNELASILGGVPQGEDAASLYLSTDTRELMAGDIFLALRGERFDGNMYVKEALLRGAAFVISEVDCGRGIRVKDSEKALFSWAKRVRSEVAPTVIALTGSVGKTTVKNTVASLLSRVYRTHKTQGNLNNLLGVPFTLLSMPQGTEFLVAEAGMNHAGELARLSELLVPDAVVITNVGTAHIGNLGSRRAIARAKKELLLSANAGAYYLYPANEPLLFPECHSGLVALSVGETDADCTYTYRGARYADIRFGGREYRNTVLFAEGRHNAYAAALGVALGVLYGLSEGDIRTGLKETEQDALRGEVRELCGARILTDCYNASPEAMKAGCDLLMQAKGRRLALLGDMLELGEHTRILHEEVGEYFARAGLDMLFTYGAAAECIGTGARRAGMAEECVISNNDPAAPEVSAAQIAAELRAGDTLLIKASRALRAERVLAALCKIFGEKKEE